MSFRPYTSASIAAAAHLAGVPVEIRHARPPYQTAMGSAHKTAAGGAVIYVVPNLPDPDRLRVYLHELAHLRLHWQFIPTAGHEQQPGGSISSKGMTRLGDAIGRPVEAQADRLADEWMQYADARAAALDRDYGLGWFKALIQWKPKEMK